MENERPTDISALPLVLTIEDVMKVFSIGRNSAYELVRAGTIRSVRIGHTYRIPRDAVSDFLRNEP